MEKNNIDKKIIKGYELLYKFNKHNKFKEKKINNFIHVYLLYIQQNYVLDFKFKNTKNEKTLYQCLKFFYKKFSNKKIKNVLFPKQELLSEIFICDEKFNPKKYLQKLSDKIYANNYININIEIIDYLGNSNKDMELINNTLCIIFFKELYPKIPIEKKIITHLVNNILSMANRFNQKNNYDKPIIKYTNTHGIFLLFLLKKIHKIPNLDLWISHLLENQLNNGKWNNGYNSYFITDPAILDIVHTSISLIVLLEYKTLLYQKNIILHNNNSESDSEDENINDKNDKNVNDKNDKNDKNDNINDNKNDNINVNNKEIKETFSNIEKYDEHKDIIENFEQLTKNNKTYYTFNFTIYNISLTILTIILIYILIKLNKKVKK